MKAEPRRDFLRPLLAGNVACAACLFCAFLCARSAGAQDVPEHGPDVFEPFNRSMFILHEGIDRGLLKPLGQGYDVVVPLPMKMSVGNFYENFRDLNRGGNAFLQGRGQDGMASLERLFINSTLGIFGLFDVAGEMGIVQREADFGQTLGVWGLPPGPYLFLPVVGPGTVRDFAGALADQQVYPPWRQTRDRPGLRNSLLAADVVRTRAALLPADRVLEEAALDKYTYIRSAYLQRRAALVRDARAAQ